MVFRVSAVYFGPILVVGLVLVTMAGCRPDRAALARQVPAAVSSTEGASADSPVVARIGNRAIRFDEVTANLDALPVFVRMRYQSPERRLEFLEAFIEFQVLALAASSEGLGSDPLVVDELKRDLVSRYLRENVDSTLRVSDIPESEVTEWYESHQYRFRHPAQNRVSRIVVADEREARRLAFRASEMVRSATGDPIDAFSALVKPPWVAVEGALKVEDLGFLPDVSGSPSVVPPAVADAGAAMTELFSVAGPIQAGDGWSVLFLAARRPAADVGIDQARTEIASLILEDRRVKARRALAASLRAGRTVSVDESVLAEIAADAAASGGDRGMGSIR